MRKTRELQWFMDRVYIDDKDCWLWKGATNQTGYPNAGTPAYRLSYESLVGPIPEGAQLDHRKGCPRLCINPKHMTPVDRDMNNRLIGIRRRGQMHRSALRVSKHLHEEIGKRLRGRYA